MANRCSARVSIDSWRFGQCSRKAIVERDGKWYCKIHDPEYIKTKDEEREAKYQANSCKQCGYHFSYNFFRFCPLCGTKRYETKA